MSQTTLSNSGFKFPFGIKKWLEAYLLPAINAMMTALFADHTVSVNVPLHASRTIHTLFVARRGYTVTSIDYTPDIAQGGALTACVVKATGTATPAVGTTPMQSSTTGINLNGTAHTVQSIALSGTAANLTLVAGDRVALVLSGAMSVGCGCVTVRMTRS